MEVQLVSSKDYITKRWSGGTTTEMFIYPKTASLRKLNFDFRISKATIEIENSIFTPLKDVERTFLLLEGAVKLEHKNQHSSTLEPFQQDTFSGNWETSSNGTCSPLNLMTMNDTIGQITPFELKPNEELKIASDTNNTWLLLYVNTGNVDVKIREKISLQKNDMLIIKGFDSESLKCKSLLNSSLIMIKIKCKKKH